MELDFDKYCIVDGSPTTVLPVARCHSKVANRKSNGKPKCGNYTSSRDADFAEINFDRYRSASCRDGRSRRSTWVDNERPKRGSVYQCSKEVMQLKKDDAVLGRKKIEFSRGSASALSFGIIESLCSSDEDSSVVERNKSSVMSLSEESTSSFCESQIESRTRDSTSYPIPQSIVRKNISSSDKRGPTVNLHKSLSAKLALPHSPTHCKSGGSKPSSPKVRFNPARKTLDPLVKCKSHRSPLSCVNENGLETPVVSCNESWEEKYNPVAMCSPAHLHGILKLEKKHGMPIFEFSVKSLEDVCVAKMWKADNPVTWIYTFFSLHPRRKSNASGWRLKDNNRESPMVGQMNVSCYLCKELASDQSFNDSMVTEFVLYDVTHLRTNSHWDNSIYSPDVSKVSPVSDEPSGSCEQNEVSTRTKHRGQFVKNESSDSQPLAASELHPELEIAAMVVRIPFIKRASLKFKSGEVDIHVDKEISDTMSPGKMNVVIPDGNHSRPSSTETCGPSRLLDRWRLGGGCGCGGWDMACPLHVFGNPNFCVTEDNRNPTQLFVQGRRDNLPAFSMRVMEGGKYAVDFHAQLSSLQAFAICISTLHTAETSDAERSKHVLQSDSLRVFADEEIESSMDAIGDEDKFNNHKRMTEGSPYFVLNPPFSPIARV